MLDTPPDHDHQESGKDTHRAIAGEQHCLAGRKHRERQGYGGPLPLVWLRPPNCEVICSWARWRGTIGRPSGRFAPDDCRANVIYERRFGLPGVSGGYGIGAGQVEDVSISNLSIHWLICFEGVPADCMDQDGPLRLGPSL